MKKRIVIFDDDNTRRDSLSILLNLCTDLECVGAFANAVNAVKNIGETNPDLVLMDIDMPGTNGIQATTEIKKSYPGLTIIMQTVFEDNDYIFESLKAGANGYLLKQTHPDKFLEQIREAFIGGAPMTGSIAAKVLQYFYYKPPVNEYKLTEREMEILKLLVAGHSYKMIAANSNISYNTVCNHITKIYHKLHVNSASEAVNVALTKKIV